MTSFMLSYGLVGRPNTFSSWASRIDGRCLLGDRDGFNESELMLFDTAGLMILSLRFTLVEAWASSTWSYRELTSYLALERVEIASSLAENMSAAGFPWSPPGLDENLFLFIDRDLKL